MCLIVFAWQQHVDYPLILAANRDEVHARPAEPMAWWPDKPSILGGRDLQAGGTWLAIAKNGRFATVTNYRENTTSSNTRTRGEIVTRFLENDDNAETFTESLDDGSYSGFSVLAKDRDQLVYKSNRGDAATRLDAGTFGLSNAALDTPWPKLVRTRDALNTAVREERLNLDTLFDIVSDRQPADERETAAANLPFEMERAISAPFIVTPDYGTRCSTALLFRADGHIEIAERRFEPSGELSGESRFVFLPNHP